MTTVYETLERPLVVPLARMERRGISIDREILSRLSGEFAQGMARIEAEIYEMVGAPFNLGSPKQLGDILFGQMGLPGGKKTATGAWSTSASVLDDLAEEGHKLPARILDWRQLSKLKSTYTDALPGFVNPRTQRVHTSYALASTTTGRLSSSDPNLQNIPVRNEEGRKIRRAFVADARPQADLGRLQPDRAAAARPYRRHPALKTGVRRRARHPRDDRLGNVRRADQGHAERGAAPRQGDQLRHHLRHFGLRPRQSARHSARGGRRLYPEIFRALPRHPRLHGGDQEAGARGRLRAHACSAASAISRASTPSNPSERAFNERAAINAPIQGSAADIIRRAMVRMDEALARGEALGARMLLQVHDELVFEAPDDEIEATIALVSKVMVEAPAPAVAAERAAAGRRARGAELGRGALTLRQPTAPGEDAQSPRKARAEKCRSAPRR